jgi:ribosomal protein S18 acetylase RimI-like enzyme
MMSQPETYLRAAEPTFEEGKVFARYLDLAADGFFRIMLGVRSIEILASVYTRPKHDFSYQYVTFAERDGRIIGMYSGYTADQHLRSSDRELQQAAGSAKTRIKAVSLLFSPMLRFIDIVPGGEFYLQTIAVDPAFRGKGVGTLLLDGVEVTARENGAQRLSLDVFIGNGSARRLYERRGMRVQSQWPKWLPIPGFKIYRMAKTLQSEKKV